MRDAISAYKQLGDPGLQLQLALEVAETRAHEYCGMFTNVVMVTAGFKTKRTALGVARLVKLPCVTFIVRSKWKSPRSKSKQVLPSHVLAFAGLNGERRLFAVPTDVVSETSFYSARSHAPAGIDVHVPSFKDIGNVTCAAYLKSDGGEKLVALSCQHVLSPVRQLADTAPIEGAEILVNDGSAIGLGRSTGFGGRLRTDGLPSFDVQLGRVDDRTALAAALNGLNLTPGREILKSENEFNSIANSANFEILVSPHNRPSATDPLRRTPLRAAFLRYAPTDVQGIAYTFFDNENECELPVNHRRLIMFKLLNGGETIHGDSGSAIVVRNADGRQTLAGMHIAGGNERDYFYSYVIPAWLLFNPYQYSRLPSGASLRPAAVF